MANNFENQMPVRNQQAAQQAEAAQKIIQQSRMKKMSAGEAAVAGPTKATETGGAAAKASGQIQNQAAQAAAQQAAIEAQRRLQVQAMLDQQMRHQRQLDQQRQFMTRADSMTRYGRDVEDQIMSKRRDFSKAERELGFGEQRQLADWNIKNAKRQEDIKAYGQEVQFQTDRNLLALDQAYQVFEQAEKQLLRAGESSANRESLGKIRAYKAQLAKAQENAKKKAAQTQKMVGAATIAAGAAITFFSGGSAAPIGAGLMAQGTNQVATAEG